MRYFSLKKFCFQCGTAAIALMSPTLLNRRPCYAYEEFGKLSPVDDIESLSCKKKWNYNWRQKLTGNFTHHILLLRHSDNEGMRFLTEKGRCQSIELARELKKLLIKLKDFEVRVYSSPGALQTCDFVMENIEPFVAYLPCVELRDTLNETVPHYYSPELPGRELKEECNCTIPDLAFDEIFCKKVKENRVSIIFGHSNVLRYLLCKALQLPLDAYMRFEMHHCSITWLAINPCGHVKCLIYGDDAFMPEDLKSGCQ